MDLVVSLEDVLTLVLGSVVLYYLGRLFSRLRLLLWYVADILDRVDGIYSLLGKVVNLMEAEVKEREKVVPPLVVEVEAKQ